MTGRRATWRRRQAHENRTPDPPRRETPFKAAAPPVFTSRYSAIATGLQDLGYPALVKQTFADFADRP
jgi:hypothetical protein